MSTQSSLPPGLQYVAGVLTDIEEERLITWMQTLPLAPVVMRGVESRRRTMHFGVLYGYSSLRLEPGPPIPQELLPLRERAGTLAGADPAGFTEALVTEYVTGAAIGWHRDAAVFDPVVVGFSLGAACRMRFRRGQAKGAPATERLSLVLEPRSAYVIAGQAWSEWQHSIPAVDALRYSVTFRSVREGRAGV